MIKHNILEKSILEWRNNGKKLLILPICLEKTRHMQVLTEAKYPYCLTMSFT